MDIEKGKEAFAGLGSHICKKWKEEMKVPVKCLRCCCWFCSGGVCSADDISLC
jgi:hypothetical protein